MNVTPSLAAQAVGPSQRRRQTFLAPVALALLLGLGGGCASLPPPEPIASAMPAYTVRSTEHRGADDLLSAGLGLDGLRSPTPPSVADLAAPRSAELRRRAIWTNWRGIADLSPAGGYGTVYGGVPSVPGREYHALLRLPQARAPHRVMLQLPDAFDGKGRCLLVVASSGSRGIYGGIALGGAWGLPRGCAVVYTDKGAGTDLFDATSREGYGLDGLRAGAAAELAFAVVGSASDSPWVAYKHAHSQDNPEADWGRHMRQAAEFALAQLDEALPALAPFTTANTRIIAAGLSNGGGAVLRAAELEEDWLDAAIAIAPNVLPGSGGRALYDYSTEAALWMACAQAAPPLAEAPLPLPGPMILAQRQGACVALGAARLGALPDAAYERLRAAGWTDAALRAGTLSTGFDLWRSVAASYASAYGRYPFDAMPCGHAFAVLDEAGQPRAASGAERALWWSDGSGVGPGLGIQLVDREASGGRPRAPLAALQCLRALWDGEGEAADRVRAGIEATRARLPRAGLPLLVIHGVDDGLVPEAFSGGAYVDWVRSQSAAAPAYWRVHAAQHFDAFLGLPDFGARYVPLLPYAYAGLDALWAQLEGGPAPADAEIRPARGGLGEGGIVPLTRGQLALPGGG